MRPPRKPGDGALTCVTGQIYADADAKMQIYAYAEMQNVEAS